MKLTSPAGFADFTKKIGQDVEKAARKGMTRTAYLAQDAVKQEMGRVFDRPTRYAVGGVFTTGASAANPRASIWINDKQPARGGTPAARFLGPQIDGGQRGDKPAERAMQALGVLPAGWRVVPGAAAQRDQHGNVRRLQVRDVLLALRAAPARQPAGKGAARNGRAARRDGYFVVPVDARGGGTLPPGVYLRKGRQAASPVLLFVRAAGYRQRLDFYGVAGRVIETRLIGEIRAAARLGSAYHPRRGGV